MYFKPDHTAIKVRDFAAEIKFYEEAFGFTVCFHKLFEDTGIEFYFMKAAEDTMRLQLCKFPDDPPQRQDYGHFSVRVEDVAAAHALHTEKGLTPGPLLENSYQHYYFIKDPEGYDTEVIQPK